ncbi:MAG: DNA polymerase I [Anaerolineales bacterium]
MPQEKLVLVDGHSLAYRAFHALPPSLQTSKGELTNAVYGFSTMLLGVLKDEEPDYVVVTFDKGPSFRVRVYADYKAHRDKMPDEMREQMERIRDLVRAFSIPIVEHEDFEADDLLGTLARQAEEQGVDVVIVTGDRDALQLVDEHVTVLTSGRRFSDTLYYTPEKVRAKYGLEPEQIVDLKALMGDSSDNIPGVKGVGEKGGTKMLQKYGSLEGVLAHIEELSTRYRNALSEQQEQARLSRRLSRIICDAPVTLNLEEAARWRQADRRAVLDFLQDLEFRSLLGRVRELPGGPGVVRRGQLTLFGEAEEEVHVEEAPATHGDYRLVTDEAALKALAAQLRAEAEVLAVDTETTDTDTSRADLVGISLSHRPRVAWYLPVCAPAGEPTLSLDALRRHLGPLFADPELPKVGHNLKYDVKILRGAGLPLEGLDFDTMLAEWVLNPDSPNLGLKNLVWARLGIQMTPIQDLIGTGRNRQTMDAVPLVQCAPYACADADLALRLVEQLRSELREREQLELFRDLEMPLIQVLVDMEIAGVRLDEAWMGDLSEELGGRLGRLEHEIYDLAGKEFNINSTQQLSNILFDVLCLSTRGLRKTKTGHYSTRAEVLERLQGEHPIIDRILQHRELSKLKSTYVDSLPALADPETSRVHTSYNQVGTVTGRLSSSDPNLQNIPIRSEEGRRVRRGFIAREGWRLVAADYSQIELRVMAHVSADPGLLEAFRRGEDIHATTAAALFGVPLEEVNYDMRRVGKGVNFGLIYGQSPYGLARTVGVSPSEAERFIELYFERFPRVREYMDGLRAEATQQGYVETLLGRRRYFPELQAGSRAGHQRRQSALRMAINAPIQGTAADIIKRAMLDLHERLEGLRARMIMQVHDELVVEAPEEDLERVVALTCEAMEGAYSLQVPLRVDVEVGQNWEEMEPYVWSSAG